MNSESRVFGETMRLRRVKKLDAEQANGSSQVVASSRNDSEHCRNGVCELAWKPERKASSLPRALKFGVIGST